MEGTCLNYAKWGILTGVANGTLKILDLGNFGSDLEISEAFGMSLKVSFFMCFFRPQSVKRLTEHKRA